MTVWDKIYKNYQKGGEAWATLSEEIHPLFQQFLNSSKFVQKCCLDIGCGTGKYLKMLQSIGFKTDGIDSSDASVAMTKKLLGDKSVIVCANMFEFQIPKNKYDLIVSVSTIHHGTKEQVQTIVQRIYDALVVKGKIFITLPDFESSNNGNTFKDHKKIAEGTFAPLSGPERGLPHSFYTKEEVGRLFHKFKGLTLKLDEVGRWLVMAER